MLTGHPTIHHHGDETARVLMLSTRRLPSAAVYPDSDKIGIWSGFSASEGLYRRESTVDYYDREP